MNPFSALSLPAVPPKVEEPREDGFLSKVMKDPWFRFGMAMLEQGGGSGTTGQHISRAVASVQDQEDRDEMRQQRRAELARMQNMQQMGGQMLQGIMGQQSGPPVGAPPAAMMAPPSSPAQPMPAAPMTPPPVADMIAPRPGRAPGFRVPSQYEPMIRRAAEMYGVPYELLAAQAQHESANTWDPNVKGTSGEIGIPQFMPATAREYGLIDDRGDRRNDPEASFNAQARFMSDLKRRTGNWRDALHRYNASPGNPAGQRYARTVLNLAGWDGEEAPQSGGQAPQAPQPMPQSSPSGQQAAPAQTPSFPSGLQPISPDLHRMFLMQAYAEGGGDPMRTVQSYYRLANQYQIAQAAQRDRQTDAYTLEVQKDILARNREIEADARRRAGDQQKLQDEIGAADNKKFQEELGKQFADNYGQITKAGNEAQRKIDRLNVMQDMLGRVYTGAGGNLTKDLVKIGALIGIEGLDEKASAADVADSLISQMALTFRSTASGEGMPGAMSDADRQFLMSMPPGFEKTPGGNKVLIEFYKRAYKRDQQVAKMARAYRGKKGGFFDDGFEDEMASWYEANPLFKPGELQQMLGAQINPAHIQRLKANPTPEEKALFDAAFGEGAADRALKEGK